MQITLRLYGNLRKYAADKRDRTVIEITEGMTIQALLLALGVPDNGWWMAALNDTVVEPETTLHDGDLLEVFDPVGGG
ncbi:MAG: MoaD/ThiS family protein [Anaerolineae bacterium]